MGAKSARSNLSLQTIAQYKVMKLVILELGFCPPLLSRESGVPSKVYNLFKNGPRKGL